MTAFDWSVTATRSHGVPRSAGLAVANVFLVYAAVVVALVVAISQRRPAIFAFALAALALGCAACMAFGRDWQRALALFLVGYIARFAAATLNWMSEQHGGVWVARFATDGQGSFDQSHLPLPIDFTGINSPGWLVYNRAATVLSGHLGGAHLLANVQMQLFAGALVAPIAYAFARRLALGRSGWWAAWLIALHPMLIAYSSALIRDETVSMFGFAAVLLATTATGTRSRPLWRWIGILALLAVIATLREPSAFYFAAVCGLVVLSSRKRRPFRLLVAAAVIVALVAASAVYTGSYWFFRAGRLQDQVEGRQNDEGSQVTSGIADAALLGGGVLWIPAVFSLHFIAPFPFYRVFAPSEKPSFDHYCLGAGALLNQALLALFIAGALIALARRNRVLIACTFAVVAFAFGSTLLLGDPARYMSAHATPFMTLIAMYGWQRLGAMRGVVTSLWLAVLIAAHAGYFLVKARYGG